MEEYCDDYGEYELRVQIPRYLSSSRGVNFQPEQIIVCTRFIYAIELLSKTIKHKYKSFAIEHPDYHIARRAFENFDYDIEKIKINKNGL